MRAIAIDAYGGPERLQVMNLPIPREVLARSGMRDEKSKQA
jgi:hypothetical protein